MQHWLLRSSVPLLLLAASFACNATCQESSPQKQVESETTAGVASIDIPNGLNPASVIDFWLDKTQQENSLTPATAVEDVVFARRIYLDLIGRVPRSHELHAFESQDISNKRELLVDRLLASEEHADHFAEVLDAILIGRTNAEQVKKRTEASWISYLKNAIHENRPWNLVARELVLARPNNPEIRGAAWYLYARKDKHQDIAEAVSKDIFGVRIDCAQCHDHPLADEIKQRDYWGLVAFFNRSKNVDTPEGPRIAESAIGGFSDFANLEGSSSPNELRFLGDRYVEEMRPAKDTKEEERDDLYLAVDGVDPKVPKFSRREQFAEKVLADHPLMGKAMVNRLWGWMMGRGIVHPVDSLDSFHPASHPELLDWLSRDFANSNYDVRRFLKSIALTKAYQYTSNNADHCDPKWFATSLPKPLTAEMLQRSMLVVLEPIEPNRWNALEQRAFFANIFPDVLTEESIANVAQGLLLSNGESIVDLVSIKQSRFLQQVAATNGASQAIELLFQGILGRKPTDDEVSYCLGYWNPKAKKWEQAIEGLAWALITSAEFRFNH